MPYLTMAPNGSGLSAGGVGKHERVKRERCKGLTVGAARRQQRFLQSVRSDLLDGQGLALTLTIRDLPLGPEELHEALEAFYAVCVDRGMIRGHWVMENQKRGVPHFHLALYFPEQLDAEQLGRDLVKAWCRIAGCWGAKRVGQNVDAITSGTGWAKYCAKHAARSVRHYQREGLPAGWDHSGRLWGRWMEWPTEETRLYVDAHTFVELRRLLRAWRHADASKALAAARASLRAAHSEDWRRTAEHHVRTATARVRSTKHFHGPKGDDLDELRAVSRSIGMREWVPMRVMDDLLRFLEFTAGSSRPTWKARTEHYGGRPDLSAGDQPWRWRAVVYEVVEYDADGCEIAA